MIFLDKYAYYSGLKDVHPLEKIAFMLLFLLFTIIFQNNLVSIVTFLIMSVVIVGVAKIPLFFYLKLLLLPFFFLSTSVIAILLSFTSVSNTLDNPIWVTEIGFWKIYISSMSFNQAVSLAFTAIGSVSCMYFLILTTPMKELIWLLQKARIPALFIELVLFTYRFIFVLLDKTREIYVAQASRLGYHQGFTSSIFTIGQLIVSLFIKSIRTAREFQVAIDSRGGEEALFDVEINQRYNRSHWLFISICKISLLTLVLVT